MNELSRKEMVEELGMLIETVEETRTRLDRKYERLEVALSGILRLIGEQEQTIRGLGGDREQLQGYVVQEVARAREETDREMRGLIEQIREIATKIEKSIKEGQ